MTKRRVTVTDPRALRGLAHPTRLLLLGLLRKEGPLTATRAGELIGESSGTCSFHLRQLARYGLVEPAEGGRGREKPWQATSLYTSWSWAGPTTEAVEAGVLLSRVIAQRYVEQMFGWLDEVPQAPASWRRASEFGDSMMYLTADELSELHRRLEELAEPYLDRLTDPSLRPRGSRAVSFLRLAFPQPASDAHARADATGSETSPGAGS
jgi:DNA-binding transcriptional ArsR family regulator